MSVKRDLFNSCINSCICSICCINSCICINSTNVHLCNYCTKIFVIVVKHVSLGALLIIKHLSYPILSSICKNVLLYTYNLYCDHIQSKREKQSYLSVK